MLKFPCLIYLWIDLQKPAPPKAEQKAKKTRPQGKDVKLCNSI